MKRTIQKTSILKRLPNACVWIEIFNISVILALLIDILSVMLDIIVLSTYFPNTNSGHTEKFSAVIAIFNLFFR